MAVGKKTNYCSPLKRKHANGPKRETLPLNTSTKRYHQAQAPNATTKRKHQTQALMGATRPASGKLQCAHTK